MIIELASIIATGTLGVGVIITSLLQFMNNKAKKLQLFNQAFNNVIDVEKTMLSEYKKANNDDKIKWDGLFFNAVEHFCYLINNGYFNDNKLYWFYARSILHWYEDIFEKHLSKKVLSDQNTFPETKSIYYNIKNQFMKK